MNSNTTKKVRIITFKLIIWCKQRWLVFVLFSKELAEDLEMNLNMDQDNDLDNLKETETDKDFEKFKKITNNQSEQVTIYF